jgi:hyperosmotically inducible protein
MIKTEFPETAMSFSKTTLWTLVGAALFMSVTAYGISTAVDYPRTLMARGDYNELKRAIETDARAAAAKCRDEAQTASRDLCKARAKADERVRIADLDARYYGTVRAGAEARLAHVKARYEVAKARCASEPAHGRIACLRNAREESAKALAEAKAGSSST